MKKILYGTVTLALLTSAPLSYAAFGIRADQPWSGIYGGFNVGYGWNDQKVNESASTIFGISSLQSAINAGAIPASLASDPSGALGGFEVNYNYGINHWFVAGVAADFDWANIYSNETLNTNTPPYVPFSTTAQQSLQSLSTIRLLLGITPTANYPLLVYVTGGFGIGKMQLQGSISNPDCNSFYCGNKNTTDINSGWTAGAGLGYQLTPYWIVKAEYLYYALGTQSQQILDSKFPNNFLQQNVTYNGNIFRFGLNYKFL